MKDFHQFRQDLKESLQDKLYRKEYIQAEVLYRKMIKRGDKPAMALHRAASSFKHVSDRGLKKFMDKGGAAARMARKS